jgi:hypothetical protein
MVPTGRRVKLEASSILPKVTTCNLKINDLVVQIFIFTRKIKV